MIWFLVLGGIFLILLGLWGGPRRQKRPDKAARIPKEATVQEAWEILTSPVQYDEELIKIPEHRPWYIPGADRRFQRGLLVGLGLGLLLALMLSPLLPRRAGDGGEVAHQPPQEAAGPAQPAQPAQPEQPAQPTGQQAEPAGQTQPEPAPPPPPPKPANITFTVEPGSTSQEIAANLKAAGLIPNEQEFLELVAALGVETRLQAGTFVIPTDASVDAIIAKLTE
ncbi:MAG: hypothetical protein ACOY93_04945 [Bacillota bacterium]